jgi:hypothetical protein
VGLRAGADGEDVVRVAGERGDAPRLAVVRERAVHLVRDDVRVVVARGLDDGPEGLVVEHPAGGVRGRTEDDRRGVVAHPLDQAVGLEVVGVRHRDLDRAGVGEPRLREVVGPRGRREEDLALRRADAQRREVERLHPAGRDDDLVGVVDHVELAVQERRDGLAEFGEARVRGVVGRPVARGRERGVGDVLGRVEVRFADLESDGVAARALGFLRELEQHADGRPVARPDALCRLHGRGSSGPRKSDREAGGLGRNVSSPELAPAARTPPPPFGPAESLLRGSGSSSRRERNG